MHIEGRQLWQMAAGDTDRNFSDLCLQWGIIMLGPGRQGNIQAATTDVEASLLEDGISSRMISILKQFAFEVKTGDIVVLRLGKSEVHGVGVVKGKYGWSSALMDIDGWDLCHYFPVEWIWSKPDKNPMLFKDALNFGNSLQKLVASEKTANLFSWLQTLPETEGLYQPPSLPPCGRKLSIEDLCQPLYDSGVSLNSLSSLKDCISELQALARWYIKYSNDPSEHETVTHLIVPLLKALGWTPQRMALEYHQVGKGRADIALYTYGNRQPKYLTALVEAKKFQRSCLKAEAQVRSYMTERTDRLIVTDGIRYGVFCKQDGIFPDYPSAYLNLAQPLDAYPIYGGSCAGGDEALWLMNADWQPGLPKLSLSLSEVSV